MKIITILALCILFASSTFVSCNRNNNLSIESPDKKIYLIFELINGQLYYSIDKEGKSVIKPSKLGFLLKNLPSLDSNFIVKNHKIST